MSSGLFCMLETKDEDKEEGEVSTELVQEEGVAQLEKDSKSSSNFESKVPSSASKPSLPPAPLPIPNLSSSCCDIPVVFGDSTRTSTDYGTRSISKVILSAVSPWLASLIQGISTN